jgi:transmembrane protein EpsG
MDRVIYAFTHIDWGIGYIITILIFLILSCLEEFYKSKIFTYIFLLYLIIFSSTRDIVNPDMENYKQMYENYKLLSLSEIEPGFIFLSWIFNHFTSSPYLLFSTYSLLNILFVYFAIRNLTPYVKTSFFLFLTTPMLYLHTLIGIRQSLAEAILFFAISLLLKREFFLFLFFGLLSVLFHYSALVVLIITIVIYIFMRNRINIKFLYSILIISLTIHFSSFDMPLLRTTLSISYPLLPEKYRLYANLLLTEGHTALKGFSILTILIFNILTVFAVYYSYILLRKNQINENYIIILNLLVLSTVYVNLFGKFSDVTARIFYYFIFHYTILLPYIIYKIHKNQIERILVIYVLSVFMIIWFFSGVYKQIAPDEPPPLIYKNILLKYF